MDYSQFIKVYDVIHKDPVRCFIDKETRAEDIVIDLCQRFNIKPVARHLFALCFHNTKEWVSPLVKLVESKTTTFDFRLRFKVPDFSKLRIIDNEAYQFYFNQARSDVLNNKVSEISCEKNKKELIGMGVADMYRVILETGASRDSVESDYKKFIPKEVYKRHMFFVKQPMHDSLVSITKCVKQGKHEAWFVKDQYLKQLESLAPNYLCEDYKAFIDEGGTVRGVTIHVNPYDKEFPGIKFLHDGSKEWIHLCTIEELCFITVRSDGSMEIARKTGIPVYFKFFTILSMFSLVSLLDGYYRLGVKWTFSLSKDLPTPSLEKLHSFKCHGPVGGEFSYSKLEKLRSNKAGTYIIRESELAYDEYYLDVCVENSRKPSTYKIERVDGEFCFNREKKRFATIQDLLSDLRSPESSVKLVECLPPSEYDISPLLLCRVEKDNYDNNEDEDECMTSDTHFIGPKELQLFKGNKKEHQGRISIVYRGVWRRKKRRKLGIALKVFKSDDHTIEEQLEMMAQWASIQSPVLVRLYGLTLNSPLGMVMELLPLGPLDAYIRHHAKRIKEVDLVEAANYLATALWNLEEAGMVHGNIRCHKLLVAAHTDSSFVVRLSDPGLSHRYTDTDVHWLAPECYQLKDNSYKTPMSDVWAFGTTLWEIFSKGQQPSIPEPNIKQYYLSGRHLQRPKGCSLDLYKLMQQCWTLDPQRRKKSQEAMRDINHLLYQVFNSRRIHSYSAIAVPKSQRGKMETVNFSASTEDTTITSDMSMNSSGSVMDFSKQWGESSWLLANSQELHPLHPLGEVHSSYSPDSEMSTMFSHLDFSAGAESVDSISELQCIFELGADCNLVLQGRIGQGFYGEVYRGSLERLDGDVEPEVVAVKKLKTNCISANIQDFEREIDIMKRLKHENIVQIKAVLSEKEVSLVMEYIPHGSLQCYLKINRDRLRPEHLLKFTLVERLKHENIVQIKAVLSEPEVSLVMEYIPHGSLQCYLKINRDRLRPEHLLKFALDVAKGMEYLGHKNIVHRDLAARNILVANDSHVKISDFGLAQAIGSNDYYILKTCRELPIKWYAPESLRDGKFSTRSDMWSYGITLFEMFSLGEDPQVPSLADHCTDQAMLLAALEEGVRLPCPPPCPQHIFVTLIHPCWLYDSHARPTFKDVAQTIEQLRSTYLCAAS